MQRLILYVWLFNEIEFICFEEFFDCFVSAVYFYIDIAFAMT